ncbi:MAG: FtsX-like permease family protein [Balneolaceae bacterium]
MPRNILPDLFSIKTAWRDSRSRYLNLLLYCSGIIAGVAALVAILSFRNDVLLTVEDQSRELLGADLEIRSNQPYSEPVVSFIDSIGGEQSTSLEFSSMVLYGPSEEARLSQVRAFEGTFPFYGELKTIPREAADHYQKNGTALVDQPIMTQLGLSVGDSIRVGNQSLRISGVILEVPGESAAFSLIGPRIFIPKRTIESTSLVERGSRIEYKTWFRFNPERDMDELVSDLRPVAREHQARFTTVESRKERFSSIVDNLSKFLGMIGFIALLLGGLGVASAVYLYIKRQSNTVATLRCLGVSSRQTLAIFTLQIAALSLAGALIGSVLGIFVQQYLPSLFADFLPFEIVQQISFPAIALGVAVGLGISLGFALLPLASINKIPPLLTLRNVDFSPMKHLSTTSKVTGAMITLTLLTGTLAWLLQSWQSAFLFTIGLMICLLLLLGTANMLTRSVKKLRLRSFSYIWRQGISNLFRPNNQTTVLITTLGMGMLLIGVVYLSQDMILERINFQTGEEQPNLILYDIQSDQNREVLKLVEDEGARVLQNVPIVSMRISQWNGRPVNEVREDTTLGVRGWALRREYRVTYRDHLTETEEIIDGEWIGQADGIQATVPISVHLEIAEDLELSIGDSLTFDVQGVPVQTRVASIREVDFQQPQPNFFILFPSGVLEAAPQFYATVLRTEGDLASANLQQKVVQQHPNVSAIDIGLVLESVRQFLGKVAMAIQFMALFSILTGLIVLASAIAISRFQRIREAVLLRTIGAQRAQINGIQVVEYLLLGLLACFTGLILAFVSSWLMAIFYFDLAFVPNFPALLIASALIVILTLLIGLYNMRGVLNRKPLDILRLET